MIYLSTISDIILSLQPTPVLTEESADELAIVVGLSAIVVLLLTLGIIVVFVSVVLCMRRRRTTRKKKSATNVAHQSSSSQVAATTHELRRVPLPLPPIAGLQNYTPTPNNNTLSLRGTENVAYGAHVSQGSGPDSDGYDYPFVTP